MKTRLFALLVFLTLVAFTSSAQAKVIAAPTNPVDAAEGGANGSFSVGLDAGATFNHRIEYTMSGSATEGVDYIVTEAVLCWVPFVPQAGDPPAVVCPDGVIDVPEDKNAASRVILTIEVIDDLDIEDDETITITLTSVSPEGNVELATLGDPPGGNNTDPSATITLTSDDVPEISIAATTQAEEPATNGLFTVTSTLAAPAGGLTINYTVDGASTATSGDDYVALTGSVVITEDNTTATIDVTVNDDVDVEGSESVIVNLTADVAYTLGSPAAATVNIADNDLPPEASITATQQADEEGPVNGEFTVTLNSPADGATTVNYMVNVSSTATDGGTDYDTLSGSVVVADTETTATIAVVVNDDADVEGVETVIVDLAAGTGYTIGSPAQATVNIADNDVPTEASITATQQADEEGPVNGEFTVTLSSPADGATTVNYMVNVSSTATDGGTDYDTLSGSVVVADTETTATIAVVVNDDADVEGSESVIVDLAAGTGYTIGSPAQATVNIADNDSPTEASITATQQADEEGPVNGEFTVTLSSPADGATTVNYMVNVSSTATDGGTDYDTLSGSVVVADTETTATIAVVVNDDADVEGSESVIVDLAAGTGYTIGSPAQATVNIADNDSPTEASITATAQADEEGPVNGEFTVTLSNPADGATTVNYMVNVSSTATDGGTDYDTLSGSVVVADTETTATIAVVVNDDADVEVVETVIVDLAAGTGYTIGSPAQATVNIADNDSPTEASITATQQANEEGPVNGEFTVTLSNPADGATTVNYMVNVASTATDGGTDYDTLSGSVVVADTETTATIAVVVNDDADPEVVETVIVDLAAGTGYTIGSPAQATVNIADNDSPTEASITATQQANEEGPVNGEFTVTLSNPADGATTVNYTVNVSSTATDGGADYDTLSGSVVVADTETTATIAVVVNDDADVEGSESVIVDLAAGTGYTVGTPAQATVNIADNDGDAALTLVKSANTVTYSAVDDVIFYSYLVTSTGAGPVAGPITVADDKETVTCPPVSDVGNNDDDLDPAESLTCTATHTVVQADIDAASLTNTAMASGDAGATDSNEDMLTVNYVEAVLTLVKTADVDFFSESGDIINYEYEVTASGGPTPGPITVDDDKTTVDCPVVVTLEVDESVTCTSTYAVVADDITAGFVTNVATASGNGGATVSNEETITVDYLSPGTPVLSLVVTADPEVFTEVGQVIYYSYLVSSIGNAPAIGPIVVTNDRMAVSCPPLSEVGNGDGNLDVDESFTCTSSTVVTLDDTSLGYISTVSTAEATGSDDPVVITSVDTSVLYAPLPIPTLSEWSMILLSFLFLLMGVGYLRERQVV